MAQFQRALELLLAEFRADVRNQAGGMKVQMDLAKSHGGFLAFS